jgi:chromosome segregation ATPase
MKTDIHEELIVLQAELARLTSAIEHIENAKKLAASVTTTAQKLNENYSREIAEIKNLTEKLTTLATKSELLLTKINTIDFQLRLDKMDNSLSVITLGNQNTQNKLEKLQDDYKTTSKDLSIKLDTIKSSNTSQFTWLKVLFTLSILGNIIVMILFYYKVL